MMLVSEGNCIRTDSICSIMHLPAGMINRCLLCTKGEGDPLLDRERSVVWSSVLFLAGSRGSLFALRSRSGSVSFNVREMEIRGSGCVFDCVFFVVHVQLNSFECRRIAPLSERLQGSRPDNPALVSRSILQRLRAGWVGVRSQDLGGRGTDRRDVVLSERFDGFPAKASKRDKTDAFGYSEGGELLRVSQQRLLRGD